MTSRPLRRSAARALAALGVALATLQPSTAGAQVDWRIENISPLNSNGHASDPNSASGGRVNKLGTDPTDNRIHFAASEWGGLHRTDDGGRNWTYVAGHKAQAVWDVEFHPSRPGVVVATSRFDGKTTPDSGINVSLDGGVTWAVPPTARPAAADCLRAVDRSEPEAYGIAFDPADADTVYVGTSCGLAVSADGGATWRHVDPTPDDAGGLRVWAVNAHHGVVDICGDEGHLRSTDKGVTFSAGGSVAGGVCSLAASPDEVDVIFLSVGQLIFESRDGGATWPTEFENPGPQGRIPFVKVNDRDGRAFDLWFGDTQLYRAACTTPVSGASAAPRCPASSSWALAQTGGHWDVGDIAFDPAGGAVDACPTLFSNDGGVYFNQRTSANCHDPRWQQPTTTVTALWLWSMAGTDRAAQGEEGVYIGQQDSGAFGTRDGGKGARAWNSPTCCDVFDVETESNRVVYTVCCFRGGRATRMMLAGDTMGGSGEVASYPPGKLVGFKDNRSLANYAPNSYAVVTNSGVFFSADIGASPVKWHPLGTGAPANACGVTASRSSALDVVFHVRAGPGACSMGSVGSLWRHDGAASTGAWVPLTRAGKSQFGAYAVDPADPRHVIATDLASGIMPETVRTVDGGATWAVVPGIDTLLAGNGAFLARVQQGFGAFEANNGYAQTSLVAISPHDRAVVLVGGQDSGLHLTANGGSDWTPLTDPVNNSTLRPHISRPLFAHFEPLAGGQFNVYIGARGRGVWRIAVESKP